MKEFNIKVNNIARIIFSEPLGYLDFLSLTKNTKLVLTDSGGIQEETTALGIPCLTLRENTERPITVKEGTNKVIGNTKSRIIKEFNYVLSNEGQSYKIPRLWDGKTAKRIADIVESQID